MQQKVIELNKNLRSEKEIPDLQTGDVINVHLKIKEGGKERIQVFSGLVIAKKGGQSSAPTITVRKVSHGVGVELILPILSKNIEKIVLVKKAKVRRAKLYYIRDLTAKQSRMKYKDIKNFIKEEPAKEETTPTAEPKEEPIKEKTDETGEVKE